jgi:hypothetical protein
MYLFFGLIFITSYMWFRLLLEFVYFCYGNVLSLLLALWRLWRYINNKELNNNNNYYYYLSLEPTLRFLGVIML